MQGDVVQRRFGSHHSEPCRDPSVTTCALWECQIKGRCRLPPPMPAEAFKQPDKPEK